MSHDTIGSARQRKPDSAKIKIKGSWTAVPNKLLKDHRLSRDARLLGCLMFMHAGNSGTTFPSQEELADELSFTAKVITTDPDTHAKLVSYEERAITVRSIQRWLTELRDAGWITWRHTLRNNAYTLVDPAESSAEALPPENDDTPDSSPPEAAPNTTAVSPHTTEGSHGHATERSPRATQESCSDVTEGSCGATQESYQATAVSPHTIPLSPSTMLESDSTTLDSYNQDSSSSDTPPPHPDDDDVDAVVVYLQTLGVSAAQEFAGLDLAAVQARVAHIQRDPSWRPGAIVKSLRTHPPSPAPATDSRAYIAQLNATYGDLFRAGSDTSDLDDVPALEQQEAGHG